MNLVIAARAESDIRNQIAYGETKFGSAVADRTFERIFEYLEQVLLPYPRTCSFDPEMNVYASWIPRTPFVVVYRVGETAGSLTVVALLHQAQNRSLREIDLED